DCEGRLESWNPAAEAMYGWKEAEVVGRQVADVLAPDQTRGAAVVESGVRVHVHKGGRLIDTRVSLAPIVDKQGQPSGWVAVCTEITAARRAEEGRRAAEERYTAVVAALEEGIVVLDHRGQVTSYNDAAQRILGDRLTKPVGQDVFAGIHPASRKDGSVFPREEFPDQLAMATGKPQAHVVMGVINDSGITQWLSISCRLLADEARLAPGGGSARTQAVVCSFSDVTDRRAAEAQLNWQANHDSLTGLANRAFFAKTLSLALVSARQTGVGMAVLFIDLDRFKLVNDSLGHSTGDEVLVATALRLEEAVGSKDLVSRLAGDEFAVLCRDVGSVDEAVKRAEQLLEIVGQPISASIKRTVSVTASVGVAFADRESRGAQDLLQDADVAMFRAKERGRARVEIFDEELRRRAVASLEDTEHLRHAIARGELIIHYQAMARPSDDRIIGLEALVRWQHPTRGFIPPIEFIPLAEETGLIVPLGRWILGEACSTMARMRRDLPGAKDANISVNLSARQLSDPELIPAIATALRSSGLPASALIMEVTETALMADAASAVVTMAEIRALGVQLAIDDFGTGYSSLAHLRSFPVEFIKIDKSFVAGLGHNRDDEAIASTIASLGRALGLTVIAEGVETAQQLDQVRQLGCDLYQGYLLSRPVPADQVRFDIVTPARSTLALN
ncbi:MAG: putative bifunctional diguanylate cyclase/phosphodiesterase, partial [Acidimicrobiales bacterium]